MLPLSTPPVMTYAQLESLINKWSLELEDQEKHFLHQATQVNAWDRMLIENGEKVEQCPNLVACVCLLRSFRAFGGADAANHLVVLSTCK